ncbi:uncharacterized protein B0H18DRAFT_958579 [Fomitopsis serialis]|uniref:uncharacterized protein n=1 Tax=Fomitopsis serialis TaxID=139415 RepID=UPI002008D016|nr:uncharacterized protein B0H18DRAFT_958579 [Neoantrodia serialis]KAH9916909.1 hypothetical protein B0H18DRAFT_958579 [Neoantrodia serialis]
MSAKGVLTVSASQVMPTGLDPDIAGRAVSQLQACKAEFDAWAEDIDSLDLKRMPGASAVVTAIHNAQGTTLTALTAALRVVDDYRKFCALVEENLRDASYDPSGELRFDQRILTAGEYTRSSSAQLCELIRELQEILGDLRKQVERLGQEEKKRKGWFGRLMDRFLGAVEAIARAVLASLGLFSPNGAFASAFASFADSAVIGSVYLRRDHSAGDSAGAAAKNAEIRDLLDNIRHRVVQGVPGAQKSMTSTLSDQELLRTQVALRTKRMRTNPQDAQKAAQQWQVMTLRYDRIANQPR